MQSNAATPQARLNAWRKAGADRVDPLRFGLMRALADRAERHDGLVRQQLDARLSALADAYAEVIAERTPAAAPITPADSPLRALLQQLDAVPLQYALPLHASSTGMAQERDSNVANEAALMPALDEFQQLWSRIRIESLLRQCLDSLPEDAGPLHSSVLTYRAMALMQDISPDYLQHFIAYVDVLTWMDQLGGGEEPVRIARKRKGSRPKA
ncbi:hypothetical protein ABB26_16535 [Stenotrophomonas humi]|uniref:DUF2894 domain-containing protein n=1 Tax=Stenotrophomonas humi TaxID=405444 RepID=A0A0R0BYI0_9GAMM|nr:DUF2894 domain-containing protein [Stenotrophomonas humi]KRG62437.1 hypothetical protein ABB26_16535 [Stenotrophomonas humi]